MVPDVFQIIVKEKGVFTNVTSPSTKAKLRILFEVAPLALMVEQAGGASSCDGLCKSALDVPILGYDQRTQVCFGSIGEVRRFEEYLYGEWLLHLCYICATFVLCFVAPDRVF
jgi:sedoheptulose-bisphosphatase